MSVILKSIITLIIDTNPMLDFKNHKDNTVLTKIQTTFYNLKTNFRLI